MSFGTFGTIVDLHLWAYSVPLAATTCSIDIYMATVRSSTGNSSTVATETSFPTPLVVPPPARRKVCLYAAAFTDSNVFLNASGYYGA